MTQPQRLLPVNNRTPAPQAVSAQGIYIHDDRGKRYIDGCCGALVANLGHGLTEIAAAMANQTSELSYVYRVHFANPAGESLAARYCQLTDPPMGSAIFVNSGSEATETAVKLARAYHLARGEERRHQVISRWQSYHGITMGALSWTGLTARRADYQPYLKACVHIPPAYCYRCWFGRNPDSCDLECARALESAIMTEGADTVSAFLIEPVVGSALAAATPPEAYFEVVRDICTRHGVLLIFDEVMTGAGRTGGRFFASDHLPGKPDVIAFGKGVGGGYYPLGGALISPAVAAALHDGPGGFTANQSHSGHPVGMAAGAAILDYFENHRLLEHAAEMGEYLGHCLKGLQHHPLVGDIRGTGLMRGFEFVRDRNSRQPFDPALQVHMRVYHQARELGLILLPSGGCDRGNGGDMALIAPPLIITRRQTEELVGVLDKTLTRVEQQLEM